MESNSHKCHDSGNVPFDYRCFHPPEVQCSDYTIHSTMMNFPYTYISCPCNDVSATISAGAKAQGDEEEQEMTFDPRSGRSNFSLFPIEHLLYCEDCQQIRCPRCTAEEIVCWFCPSCLFEMPLSVLKSEGPR